MDLAALHRAHVETLSRGTEAALEKAGFAAVAIHSGTALKRTEADDQYWPLRPTPHFQHWLPLAEPGCWLVIAPGRKPSLHRSLEYSFWEAPAAPESDHFWGSFEVASEKGSLLVDAGASFAGYGSDITRTWVKGGGALASSYGQLVAGLEAMQQRLCGSVRVGMPYEELHDQSHRLAAGVLRDVGISRLPADELVARGITRAFYPHGLGHSLGLQCHDAGCALRPPRKDNPFLRNQTESAVDQAFTIEPGIYFIDALLQPLRNSPDIDWKLVDGLQAFGGVRIEDDVVVRPNGIRNLTREVLPQGVGVAW